MFSKIKTHLKWLRISLIIALILLMLPRLQYLTIENVEVYAPTSIPLAFMMFLLIYALKPVVMFIPLPVLYVAAGIVFPLPWSILVTVLGIAVASAVGYLNGKALGADRVYHFIQKHPKVDDFLNQKTENLSNLCLFSRLIPFPFDVFSMLYGAMKMSFSSYLVMSVLGVFPKAIPLVLTAKHITNPLTLDFLIPFMISLVIIFSVLVIQKKVVKSHD